MSRNVFVAIVILCLSLAINAHGQRRVGNQVAHYTITSLKAMLFYDNEGTFSEDVALPDSEPFPIPSPLWNTTASSTSVLVTVEVNGEYADAPSRRIEFTAKYQPLDARRVIVVRRLSPIWIRENGKYIAGFWLNDAGCNPVWLSARILGQGKSTTTKKIIKFGCGE